MKNIFLIFALILVLFSCGKRPCDILVNGICPYPEISNNLTDEQKFKKLNLPEDILGCITTEGLVETCLNYPELRLIWTRNSLQDGYDYIRSHFNGLRELNNRNDAPKFLLKKYLIINPQIDTVNLEPIEKGKYSFNVVYLALIFNQFTHLDILTKDEKIKIIEKSLYLHDQFLDDWITLMPITTLMGRLMQKDGYEPFINACAENLNLCDFLIHSSPREAANVVIQNMAESYLENLKNK